MAAGIPLQKIEKLTGSGYVRKAGLPMDNSLRSDNSIVSPKGHTRSLKFYYSSSEVTRTAPSPAPKGFSSISFP